jgi:type I restriction enzyme S subunit
LTKLKTVKIPLPPLPLQQKFVQIVKKFERLRAQQRESERQAEHLFQTLLYQAFEGNVGLESRGVQDEDVEDSVQSSVGDSQLTGPFVQLQMNC